MMDQGLMKDQEIDEGSGIDEIRAGGRIRD